jgi:hypothetical protein
MLVGMTRHDPDRLRNIIESEASVDRASSSGEVDARTSFDGSLNENLFGDPDVQKALESRDVMDQQGDAQEDPITNDSAPEWKSENEDSASDKEGDEYAADESDDDIVDATVSPSPMKNRTRSKAQKVTIPEPPLNLRTKYLAHGLASVFMPAQLRYARVELPNTSDRDKTRISSQALPARSLQFAKGEPAVVDKIDQFKNARQRRQTQT